MLWVFGVVLLLLTFNASMTGTLLPWDQQAYWSTTRILEIYEEFPLLGSVFGFFVGQLDVHANTLTRFYILHAFFIPLLLFVFFYLHFATIRRIGLSPLAAGHTDDPKPLFPHHLLNLLTILLLLSGTILTLAILAPAVFQNRADPFTSPPGILPPWYLLPAYGLVEILPNGMGGILLLLALLTFLGVPFLDRTPDKPATQRPLALIFFAIVCATIGLLGYLGYTMRG